MHREDHDRLAEYWLIIMYSGTLLSFSGAYLDSVQKIM